LLLLDHIHTAAIATITRAAATIHRFVFIFISRAL
jgi:hypothetical protein